MTTLLILNDAPYGSERTYNALRLAGSLSRREDSQVKVFLIGDAVTSAKAGQKVPWWLAPFGPRRQALQLALEWEAGPTASASHSEESR